MNAASETTLLEQAARDGTLDIAEWPRVFQNVLRRLNDIVHNEFPLPPQVLLRPESPQTTDAEAAALSPVPTASQDIVPATQDTTTSSDEENDTAARSFHDGMPPPRLPSEMADPFQAFPELGASYQTSLRLLKGSFSQKPPYTIQRLAELVLHPRRHYRFLPPFLNALDRIVSVSSSSDSFPLNYSAAKTNGVIHATTSEQDGDNLAGDEGLGGALLTPIPWLRHATHTEDSARRQDGELVTEGTETIQGPNGAGRIETVSVTVNGIPSTTHTGNGHMIIEEELREQGAVTQGELLRQEQEAGVVPVAQTARRLGASLSAGMGPDMVEPGEDDDHDDSRHVRGPEEIGMEDLGPQHEAAIGSGRPLDLDAALGRQRSLSPSGDNASGEHVTSGEHDDKHDDMPDVRQTKDEEGDIMLSDAT